MKKAKRKSSPRRVSVVDRYIGARMREQRLVLKMSQAQLGRELGVSFQKIQKYESGVNRVSAARLYNICKTLNVSLLSVFECLSRISGSFVIASNTALTFKGKAVDVKHLGRELNVRYVLEGSVQRGNNRLRIIVQLIDVETGNHLWAERFDKRLADLFDMQDEIVSRLANTLSGQLIEIEARRAERTLHPDAMDLYFQGKALANKGPTPEYRAQARGFFERALVLDPGNIDALVGIAAVDAASAASHMVDDRGARFVAAEAILIKALSLAPQHAQAHLWLGNVRLFTNRVEQGMSNLARCSILTNFRDFPSFAFNGCVVKIDQTYSLRVGKVCSSAVN